MTLAIQGLSLQPGRRGQDPLGASRQRPTLQVPIPRRPLPASHSLRRKRRKKPTAMIPMKQVGGSRGMLGKLTQKLNPVGQKWDSGVRRCSLTANTCTLKICGSGAQSQGLECAGKGLSLPLRYTQQLPSVGMASHRHRVAIVRTTYFME